MDPELRKAIDPIFNHEEFDVIKARCIAKIKTSEQIAQTFELDVELILLFKQYLEI